MQIEDGKGTGFQAQVSKEHKLATSAVVAAPQLHASAAYGRAYQVMSGVRAVTGAYGLLALRNNSTFNLIVTYIRVALDDTETAQAQIELALGGTWVAGTAVTPVNLNSRFSIEADVDAHYNALPTSANTIDTRWARGPDEVVYRKEGSIILTNNNLISVKVTPETAAVNFNARISFIMLTDEELGSL
jgi:hypothetical protein